MLRHDHHRYPTSAFFQVFEESAQVIDQCLGAGLVLCALRAAIEGQAAVAVMQRRGVVEQRYPGITLPLSVLPPSVQDFTITPD
ncbi:hypothetical protein D3C84_1057210 [compost metagenome]